MGENDQATEEKILDAAHAVFLRRGSAGARMQEIAEEAGVNKALLHYYFRSKERLAEAVFLRAAGRLFPPVLKLLLSDRSIEEKVREVITIELDFLSKTPFLPGYILGELNQNPDRFTQLIQEMSGLSEGSLGKVLLGRLGQQIEEEVAAGRMSPIDPEQFVVNLISLCIFPFAARPVIEMILGQGEETPEFEKFIERRRDGLAEFFLGGIRS